MSWAVRVAWVGICLGMGALICPDPEVGEVLAWGLLGGALGMAAMEVTDE